MTWLHSAVTSSLYLVPACPWRRKESPLVNIPSASPSVKESVPFGKARWVPLGTVTFSSTRVEFSQRLIARGPPKPSAGCHHPSVIARGWGAPGLTEDLKDGRPPATWP